MVFSQKFAEVSPFFLGHQRRAAHVSTGLGHQPNEIVPFELFNNFPFHILEGTNFIRPGNRRQLNRSGRQMQSRDR